MLVAPSAAGAQSTCPPDAEGSRALIDGYMSAESFSQHRDSIGMAGLTPFHARVLTDATDLPACQRFVSQFGAFGSHPHWYWSAYKVGTFYVLAWRYVNAGGGFGIGLTPWIILDQNFAQVGGFAT
ncbi:MAG TPA: hypothetical protein VEW03_00980 [Longimicrobiaceae bacterium]|nr:hypothetical protein [Longimicrobiaceae bacterium]